MKYVMIQTDQFHFKFKVCLALFLALYPETQMRDWNGPLPHKEYIQTINCSSYSHQTRVLFPSNVKGENNLEMRGEGKKAAERKGLQKTLFASFKRRFWMKPCSEPVALRICMKLCLQRVPLGIWPAGVREYSVRLANAQTPKLTNFRKNSKRHLTPPPPRR